MDLGAAWRIPGVLLVGLEAVLENSGCLNLANQGGPDHGDPGLRLRPGHQGSIYIKDYEIEFEIWVYLVYHKVPCPGEFLIVAAALGYHD